MEWAKIHQITSQLNEIANATADLSRSSHSV